MVIDVFSKYGLYHLKINKERLLEKHFKATLKLVENLSFYGMIREVSFITNM